MSSDASHSREENEDSQPAESLSMAGDHNPWLVALVISIATFMEALDTSIANVALRHIAGGLAASVDESTWVLTSYLVSNAIVLPISGWFSSVIGRKPFYMSCVALFTLSSALCGFAPSLGWLIFFRVLQGIGGGGLAPSEQSMLADSFPAEKRGMAFAMYGVAVVVAPAVGPTLGGWITDNYSWHWIFFINVPVGLASLTLSQWLLVEPPAERRRREKLLRRGVRVDYLGFGLIALGLGCLQVVLDKGNRDDWFQSNFIITFAAIATLALLAHIVVELTRKDPIVDLPLLKNYGFAASSVLMFAVGFILFGTTQLLPQFAQEILGYNATLAGLVITPGGFSVMLAMPLVGFLLGKVQPRSLIALGFVIEAGSLYLMSGMNSEIDYAYVALARVAQAAGIAFLFVPVSTVAYVGLPPGKSNDASALINLSRNLGGSFGISLAQTWLARRAQFHQERLVSHLTPYDGAYRAAMTGLERRFPHNPREAAAVLQQGVLAQATTLAYLDIFYLLAGISLVCIPLVFLLRKTKPGQKAAMH